MAIRESMDEILAGYESRRLTRREAVARLTAVATAAAAALGRASAQPLSPPAKAQPTFRATELNHIALRVPDVARSRDFYVQHLGLRVLRDSPYVCFLACGGNHFVALFRNDRPGLDHYCYTVDDFEPKAVVERLSAAGLKPHREEDRVYFDDPDGLTVQLASTWGDYPGGRPAGP